MKTENTEFTQILSIWAIPKTSWQIENYPDEPPFDFQVLTNPAWQTGAVKVHEEEITLVVPAGIDLTKKAIDTLEEAKAELLKTVQKEIKEIDNQINNLQLIEHRPVNTEAPIDDFDDEVPF